MSKKQKNIGVKALCSVLIVLLLATIGIAIPSKGFTDWSKFKHNKPQVEQPDKPGVVKPDSGLIIDQIVANGMLLSVGTAAADEDGNMSQLFTATITPSNATNKEVDWAIAFKNPDSEWATEKNIDDYVTVTPTSDGALTATVTCKAAFGEQIELTVTSRSNPEAYAVASVDYAKRLQSASVTVSGDENYIFDASSSAVTIKLFGLEQTKNFTFGTLAYVPEPTDGQSVSAKTFARSFGTMSPEDSSVTVSYRIVASDELKAAYAGTASGSVEISAPTEYTILEALFNVDLYVYKINTGGKGSQYYALTSSWESISAALNNLSGHAFTLYVKASDSYSEIETAYTVSIDKSNLTTLVSSVALSQGSIIF